MAEFINTIDVLGDDAVIDSIINRTITEFKDNTVTTVGGGAFQGCAALETVDIPNAVTLHQYAFSNCASLRSAIFPNVTALAGSYTFASCSALTAAHFPKLVTANLQLNTFTQCPNLKTIDFGCLKKIDNWLLNGTTNPETIVLRMETVVTLAGTAGFKCAGYIYVPAALVDSYKAATNWSTYATQFRALEDYTVDGTITGALDETKI